MSDIRGTSIGIDHQLSITLSVASAALEGG